MQILIKNNDIIIIPGVGSFKQGMNVLKKNGLAESIKPIRIGGVIENIGNF